MKSWSVWNNLYENKQTKLFMCIFIKKYFNKKKKHEFKSIEQSTMVSISHSERVLCLHNKPLPVNRQVCFSLTSPRLCTVKPPRTIGNIGLPFTTKAIKFSWAILQVNWKKRYFYRMVCKSFCRAIGIVRSWKKRNFYKMVWKPFCRVYNMVCSIFSACICNLNNNL